MLPLRADFYLFRHYIVGLGTFSFQRVIATEAMKLIFGVNREFRIRLDEVWRPARAALIRGGCRHYLNGEGDWQVTIWIDPDSALWDAFERNVLGDREWTVHGAGGHVPPTEVIQTAVDTEDPVGVFDLAEILIRVYSGARGIPAVWDGRIRKLVRRIDADPGPLDTRGLIGDDSGADAVLATDFRRVLGCRLEDYLFRRKWMLFLRLRRDGMERDQALIRAGLPGWEGLRDRFSLRYGLDLETLEHAGAYVRVYESVDDQPVIYLG